MYVCCNFILITSKSQIFSSFGDTVTFTTEVVTVLPENHTVHWTAAGLAKNQCKTNCTSCHQNLLGGKAIAG